MTRGKIEHDDEGAPLRVLAAQLDITDRKNIECKLGESEEQFCRFFEFAPVGLAQCDPATRRFLKANAALCAITGYSQEEITRLTIDDLSHLDDQDRDKADFSRMTAANGVGYELEKRYVRKDGSVIWVHVAASILRDADGRAARTIAIIQDVTAHKAFDIALKRSETEYRAMFELSGAGKAQSDPFTRRFTRVNAALCEITGYDEDELLGMSIEALNHPDDRAADQARFAEMQRTGTRDYKAEKRYVRKNGSTIWIDVCATVMDGADGRPSRVVSVIQDVTERKRSEALLIAQRGILEMIAANHPADECLAALAAGITGLDGAARAAIIVADADGRKVDRVVGTRLSSGFGDKLVGAPIDDTPIGACGSAARETRPVSCEDVLHAGPWAQGWRDLCAGEGIGACLCVPIADENGEARASFFMAYGAPRRLTPWDLQIGQFGAHAAGIVLARDRSTQRVRESAERYGAVVGSAVDAIIVIDEQGVISTVNPAASRIFEYAADEMIGRNVRMLMPQADAMRHDGYLEKYRRTGERFIIGAGREVEGRRKSGDIFPLDLSVAEWRDAAGACFFTGMLRDATQRKGAEHKLRESEARFREIADSSPAPVWVTGEDGEMIFANATLAALFGVRQEKLRRSIWLDYVHHDDLPRVVAIREQAWASKERYSFEARFRSADGRWLWFYASTKPRFGSRGELLGYVGIAMDMTERKRVEDELRDSERRLRALADSMPQLVWSVGPDGVVDFYNRQLEHFAGATMKYDGSYDWAPMLHPDDIASTHQAWNEAHASGQLYQMEHRVQRTDGFYRWMISRAYPVRNASGEITRWYGTATDIHDLKETQEALAESEASLRLAQDAAGMGAWEIDLATGEARWLESLYGLLGLQPGGLEPTRDAYIERVDERDRARIDAEIDAAAQTGDDLYSEFRITRADGAERWLAGRGRATYENGVATRMAGVNFDITEKKDTEARQQLLMCEVDHRAKNALAVVESVVRLTPDAEPAAFRGAVAGRVSALARSHKLLATQRWDGVFLKDLIGAEVQPQSSRAVSLDGPPQWVGPSAVQPLSMVLHELLTNAAKHGALSAPLGCVSIQWTPAPDGRMLVLQWTEEGGPKVSPPTHRGFGSTLIEEITDYQLSGTVRFDWRESGLFVEMSLPRKILSRRAG